MRLYRFLFLFFLFSVFNSCQDILDESYKKEMNELYTSPYMGKWAGSFNGQESALIIRLWYLTCRQIRNSICLKN